jgi:hypothetical protein
MKPSRDSVRVLAAAVGLDVAQPPDMAAVIHNLAKQFMTIAGLLVTTINSVVIDISRLAYVTIILVGILLYSTHVDRRHGKDLVKGGVALAVLSEVVFPMLNRI